MLSAFFLTPDRRRAVWAACLLLGIAIFTACEVRAGEVTITVAGGRSFTAEIDPRSDAERLWLRFGTARTTIQRPIQWSAVVGIRQNGADMAVDALKQQVVATPKPLIPEQAHKVIVQPSSPKSLLPAAGGLQLWRVPGVDLHPPMESAAPVRSLAVDVYLANWDADVESDGIVVNFAALDDYGDAVPVDGALEVELIGERQPPYSRGNGFPVLGRWTQQVTAGDGASPSGYRRVRLPFQAFHPDYWNSLPSFALAHVRLVVPGQGTFEAGVDAVRLRGFSPVRDRLESAAGTRFLPTEQTGRGKRLSARGPVD